MAHRFVWIVVTITLILTGTFAFLYSNGYFANYSAGVTSCTTFNDALTKQSSQYCSSLAPLPTTPASVSALTPDGKNFTFYDSATGKSAPVVRDARLTLSAQTAIVTAYSVSSTCTALVDAKQAATNSSTKVFASLNGAKVCVLSVDGKALQSYFASGKSTHIVQYSVSGKATAFFPTGATQSRAFSGSLGNITITITDPTTTSAGGTKESIGSNAIQLPQIGSGTSQNAVTASSSVQPVSAPLTNPTTGQLNPDYVKQVDNAITTSSANAPMQVQVGTSTITVNACDVGSCSYSPSTSAGGQARVTATVSKNDISIYQRDSQQILNQFGATDVKDLTPYTRCSYFKQC